MAKWEHEQFMKELSDRRAKLAEAQETILTLRNEAFTFSLDKANLEKEVAKIEKHLEDAVCECTMEREKNENLSLEMEIKTLDLQNYQEQIQKVLDM